MPIGNAITVWAKTFGPSTQLAAGRAVAIDASGNVTVGGDFQTPIDLGGGAISTGGDFVGKFGSSGSSLWSKGFGQTGSYSSVQYLADDGSGGVIAAGPYTGTINCGGSPLTNNGAVNALFVTHLDASGNHLWSKSFGDGTNTVQLQSIAHVGSGVLLVGTYTTTVTFGGATITPSGTDTGGDFLAVLDLGSGAHKWSRGLPSTLSLFGAVDGSQNIVLSGAFTGSVDLGGGALTSAGGLDMFVARMDPSGNHLWSKRFGGADDDATNAVTADTSGNVLFSGVASTGVDFGGGVLAANAPFLVSLSSSGTFRWGLSVSGQAQVDAVGADGTNGFVVAGAVSGTAGIGSTSLPTSGGDIDLLIFKLDPSGNYVWGRRAGNSNGGSSYQLAVSSDHKAAVTGMVRSGGLDLGSGMMTCVGVCAWVAEFGP